MTTYLIYHKVHVAQIGKKLDRQLSIFKIFAFIRVPKLLMKTKSQKCENWKNKLSGDTSDRVLPTKFVLDPCSCF